MPSNGVRSTRCLTWMEEPTSTTSAGCASCCLSHAVCSAPSTSPSPPISSRCHRVSCAFQHVQPPESPASCRRRRKLDPVGHIRVHHVHERPPTSRMTRNLFPGGPKVAAEYSPRRSRLAVSAAGTPRKSSASACTPLPRAPRICASSASARSPSPPHGRCRRFGRRRPRLGPSRTRELAWNRSASECTAVTQTCPCDTPRT